MEIESLIPTHSEDVLRIGDSDDLVVIENFSGLPKDSKGEFMVGDHAIVVLCTKGMAQFDYDGRTIQLRKGNLFIFIMLHSIVSNFMTSPDFNCRQLWLIRNEAWNINMYGLTSISKDSLGRQSDRQRRRYLHARHAR